MKSRNYSPGWFESIFYALAPLLFVLPASYGFGLNATSTAVCGAIGVFSQFCLSVLGLPLAVLIVAALAYLSHLYLNVENFVVVGIFAAVSIPASWTAINFGAEWIEKIMRKNSKRNAK